MRALRGRDYLTLWPVKNRSFSGAGMITSADFYAGSSSKVSIIFATPSCSQGSATLFANKGA